MRRARARTGAPAPETAATSPDPDTTRRWSLGRIGWFLLPLFAPWAVLAYFLPSPVGVYLPAVPVLVLLLLVSLFLFGFGLLRSPVRWSPTFRRTAAVGLAAGLLLPAAFGAGALANHCPLLTPFTTAEPGGWERVSAPAWVLDSMPVLYFYGSVACPYCSASSWAVLSALEALGNVSGASFDHSSPTDSFPNTPSVVLPSLQLTSRYVALDARESLSDNQISAPTLGSCTEQAYVSAYNPFGGIPFVVVDGTFWHSGTLVDPGALAGLSSSQLAQQAHAENGSAWGALGPATYDLLAYLVHANGGAPAGVASNPNVSAVLGGIR
ncbi:MAG: DUF929 domain-containing protein [Thermoplasmata archaeon]|nr:DUF929 domain-containing protein [Thermoplasmata archaeon]